MLSPTPTPVMQDDNSAQRSNLIIAFTLSAVLILVILLIPGLMWVVIVCRNSKIKRSVTRYTCLLCSLIRLTGFPVSHRSHDKLAMPFETLRFEVSHAHNLYLYHS